MLPRLAFLCSIALSLVVGCAAQQGEDFGEGQSAVTGPSSGRASRSEATPIADMDEAKARFGAARCLTCHGFERKLVGPSFRTLADDYAERESKRPTEREKAGLREQMITRYVKSVTEGSQWKWELSGVPMPPNPDVSETEARRLIEFVLDLPTP